MKLNKFIGMGVAVLALSLALCGCGDRKSNSESRSESNSESKPDSESASSSDRAPGKFSPMVTKDATFALGVNLDKRQVFKVVDAYLDQVCSWLQLRDKDVDQVKTIVSRSKKDLFACVPWELRDLLDEKGLRDAEFRWAVISLEDLNFDYYQPLHGLSVAIAMDADLGKLIPKDLVIRRIDKDYTNDVVFTEMSLEGEKVWHIHERINDPIESRGKTIVSDESYFPYGLLGDFIHELNKDGIDLHVASLDGQLLLAASSRGSLAKQIRLYRQGKGAGDALGGFSAKEGELIHLKVDNVGERILAIGGQNGVQEVAQLLPDGERVIKGLGVFEGDVKVSSDGTVSTAASLKAASEEDADKIRTLAKVGLMAARSQWNENPYMPREFVKKLDAVKIGGTDGEIKVQNVDPLPAFGPVISSARLSADLLVMAINGRKLIMGIVQANIDRQGKLSPLWPRMWQEKDASNTSSDDVSARAYRSATDYFNALFDMEHYGTPEWDPSVDGELLSTLGKNAVVNGKINPAGLDWCIAANITVEDQDFLPVLVSANINPELLYGDQFDGSDPSPLPIGPKSGAAKSMFGDQGIVLVRKSGAAESYKVKYARYAFVYNHQSFDNSGREHPTVWLTPTGVAVPSKNVAVPGKGKRGTQRWEKPKESWSKPAKESWSKK